MPPLRGPRDSTPRIHVVPGPAALTMLSDEIWVWVGFNALLVGLLFLDLVILGRAHIIRMREAVLGTIFWTAVAFAVNGAIYAFGSTEEGTRPDSLGMRGPPGRIGSMDRWAQALG